MNIGIIGAGSIGGTLARKLSKLQHNVTIANSRGPETLKELAKEINVDPATVDDIVRKDNDIIVLTIPQKNIPDLPVDLFKGVKDDVVVIDTCNYYPLLRDGVMDELEQDITNSEWVESKIKRPLVKTFNSIAYTSLADKGRPKGDKNRIALPISGDRQKDKKIVGDLLDQLGFDSYDIGKLNNSWKYEPGTPTYCMDFDLETLKNELSDMGSDRTPKIKADIHEQRTQQEKQLLAYFASQGK